VKVETPAAFGFLWDPPLGSVRYRGAYGGRGSAKSWQFARRLIVAAYADPLRILCLREWQTNIRESVHHLIASQIDALGLAGAFSIGQTEITSANGSQFIFRGIRRDPRGIKSLEAVDVAWIEEAEALSKESWETLDPTIRKPGSEIWLSWNPEDVTNVIHKTFVESCPPDAIIRKVGYKDNPWMPEVLMKQAERMRDTDPEAYAHIWGGEPWSRSDTQVLAGKWVVEDFTPGADWDGPYYGADWGFSQDPTVIVEVWRHADRLYVYQEAGGLGLDMDQTAHAFRQLGKLTGLTIHADSARPETINEMKRRGFTIRGVEKWPGSVEDGVAHLQGYAQIVFHPRCRGAIEEARLWRYATNAAGDVLRKLVDAHNHRMDAIRYALSGLIRRRPSPAILVSGG
jgi:phage terminase large subunit